MAMKRENLEAVRGRGIGGYEQATVEMPTKVEGKMIELDEETDAGMDELLAALGYKVRSSDMADVALKLEQLEMAMGSSAAQDDQLLSHLASDTVHYNPSDLSSWLESMLSEISPPAPQLQQAMHPNYRGYNLPPMTAHSSSAFFDPADTLATTESSTITSVDFCLPQARDARPDFAGRQNKAGVNRAALGSESAMETGSSRDRKRMRTSSSSSTSRAGSGSGGGVHGQSIQAVGTLPSSVCGHEVSSAMPVVMVDTQEVGIRLVHALMACAEAVQHENYKAADVLVKQISVLASSQGGAMRKVAGYFAEALARRIYRVHPSDCSLDSAFSDILQMHFYESCPYLKFAHFTANQAILEAFAGCRRVHVIDFSMKQGMQWPALMQALALRPGGPPSFRLTGIGPPQPDNTDALQQVGWKLAQLADTIHVDFEYRGFVANSLADLEPYMLDFLSPANNGSGEPEVVAINSVFELHGLLARPGALEKVLATVRAVKPRIVTIVEQEANHNTGPFMERFAEALHYYSTMFDSLEGGNCSGEGQHDQLMSEVYLGRQICSVVACEGAERTERHETLCQWRSRMSCAGFEPVHLGSNAFKQASMLLALFSGGDGYRVEEKEGCLTLGWHTRPLIATSAWRVVGPTDEPLSANAATDPH